MRSAALLLIAAEFLSSDLAIANGNEQTTSGPCSPAISGNDNTLTCNYGLTSAQLRELTRAAVAGATEPLLERIENLSKRLGVSEETTKTLLKIVGEQPNVSNEDLPRVLTRVANELNNLRAQAATLSPDNPLARALATQVQSEINAGHLEKAGDLLQTITRSVATLNGSCTKIEAMGIQVDPKTCLSQLMNANYRDDRTAFTFVTQRPGNVAVISFSGYGPHQIKLDRDHVEQPIDKVVFTLKGSSDYLKADGVCKFANPEKGLPAPVWCSAKTSEGTFSGEFISDGSSPNIYEAGAGSSTAPAKHTSVSEPQVLKGQCEASSHIADGAIGEDLTKRESRFFCDAAVINSFGDDPRHRMIQFADAQSYNSPQLGFAGLMQDGAIMTVQNVYLRQGVKTAATDGACKLFFKQQVITEIFCGAKIDQGTRRTVPVVVFTVETTAVSKAGK